MCSSRAPLILCGSALLCFALRRVAYELHFAAAGALLQAFRSTRTQTTQHNTQKTQDTIEAAGCGGRRTVPHRTGPLSTFECGYEPVSLRFASHCVSLIEALRPPIPSSPLPSSSGSPRGRVDRVRPRVSLLAAHSPRRVVPRRHSSQRQLQAPTSTATEEPI